MEKYLTFFRVFDLGFFVPGTILFASLLEAGWLPQPKALTTNEAIATGLSVVWVVLSVFVLGLALHAISRGTRKCWRQLTGKEPQMPPPTADARPSVATAFNPEGRQDLASYYWYMRATSFNLTTGLLVSLPGFVAGGSLGAWGVAAFLVAAGLFFWLGSDFDRALQKALRDLHDPSTAEKPARQPL